MIPGIRRIAGAVGRGAGTPAGPQQHETRTLPSCRDEAHRLASELYATRVQWTNVDDALYSYDRIIRRLCDDVPAHALGALLMELRDKL